MEFYPEDPLQAPLSQEPRSLRVPPTKPGQPQAVGVAVADIPARLVGGNGVKVTIDGLNYRLGLDIPPLQVATGMPNQQWVPVWQEGMPLDQVTRVPVAAIPADAPYDSIVYGRLNGAWVPAIESVTIDWEEITGKPDVFPPALPIPSSGVTGLDAHQTAQDNAILANQGAIATNTAKNTEQDGRLTTNETNIASNTSAIATNATAINTKVSKTGDTMTGPLVLPGAPTNNLEAATKAYVDSKAGAGIAEPPADGFQYARKGGPPSPSWEKVTGGAVISDTAPAGALPNSFWWESDSGGLFIRYDDGNSAQWVQCNAAGLPDAMADGKAYGRLNGAWSEVLPITGGTLTGGLTATGDIIATNNLRGTAGAILAGPLVFSHIANFQVGYNGSANITSGTSIFHIAFGGNNRFSFQPTSGFRPIDDNVHVLGGSSQRWTTVYATTGTISTSDEREKQDIRPLDERELAVAHKLKSLITTYRWRHAVAEKGDDARIHVGVIAQRVQEAFEAEGLDAARYGLWCADEVEEYVHPVIEDDGETTARTIEEGYMRKTGEIRYGVRYDELIMFILGAM